MKGVQIEVIPFKNHGRQRISWPESAVCVQLQLAVSGRHGDANCLAVSETSFNLWFITQKNSNCYHLHFKSWGTRASSEHNYIIYNYIYIYEKYSEQKSLIVGLLLCE